MRVTIWGTRGSIPSPGPDTVRYGGNTSCLEVRSANGSVLVLDGGTGIRPLGESIDRQGAVLRADVAITHAHWDHVQGLPFFAPLYRAGNAIRIWGAGRAAAAVRRVVRAQMGNDTFPVPFAALRADVAVDELPQGATLGAFAVEHLPASHPGGAVGFRVREGNGNGPALVYLPDNELAAPVLHGLDADWRERLMRFLDGAALLVHDAMYTEVEYASHRGWGHSHMLEVVRAAREAHVQRLVLFHHHPGRTDDELDRHGEQVRAAAEALGGLDVMMAAEGATFTLEAVTEESR